jgi:hypothetical protein
MAESTASLRHRAFLLKLALRRISAFHADVRRAALADRVADVEGDIGTLELRRVFAEFTDVHRRLESALLDEMVRLAIDADRTVSMYARKRYGFGPGDEIKVAYPDADNPARLKVHKVFLQSDTDSDVRIDGSFLSEDGSLGSRWDIYMKGPGQFQFHKIQRRRMGDDPHR